MLGFADERGGRVAILGCDRGGEFMSNNFTEYLKNSGTICHLTVHDSPASNGAVEQANQTHLDGARAMMEVAKLPKNLWAEAISHHVWICNWVPTRAISDSKTPFEMGTGVKPDLSTVYSWGCKVWVKRVDSGKLEPRAEECRFMGVDSESKGYWIYWPGKNCVSVERDVYFNEREALEPDEVPIGGENSILTNLDPPQQSNNSQSSQTNSETSLPIENEPKESETPEKADNAPMTHLDSPETQAPTSATAPHMKPASTRRRNSLKGLPHFDDELFGRGKRPRIAISHADAGITDFVAQDGESGLLPVEQGGVEMDAEPVGMVLDSEHAMAISEDEPSLSEALSGDERTAWFDAIDVELTQMEKVNAWIPVTPPQEANIIPSCYIFRCKRNDTGSIVHYKARLVVKGFKQKFGIDYVETFAPTVRAPTLRILLSFAAQKNATIHQCDVKNAYLNSRLQDDVSIYSKLPPKYKLFCELPPDLKDKTNVVCKWFVLVYGSKQGAHDWYAEVKRFFTDISYSILAADEAVFYKFDGNNYTIVAAATDDFTVIADSSETANLLIQKQLMECFEILDLGPINWLLGLSITRNISAHTISLGQQAYIEQILNWFGLEDSRKAVTPMEVGIDLSPDSSHVSAISLTPLEKTKYCEMIDTPPTFKP